MKRSSSSGDKTATNDLQFFSSCANNRSVTTREVNTIMQESNSKGRQVTVGATNAQEQNG
jgi:hypothetical protein